MKTFGVNTEQLTVAPPDEPKKPDEPKSGEGGGNDDFLRRFSDLESKVTSLASRPPVSAPPSPPAPRGGGSDPNALRSRMVAQQAIVEQLRKDGAPEDVVAAAQQEWNKTYAEFNRAVDPTPRAHVRDEYSADRLLHEEFSHVFENDRGVHVANKHLSDLKARGKPDNIRTRRAALVLAEQELGLSDPDLPTTLGPSRGRDASPPPVPENEQRVTRVAWSDELTAMAKARFPDVPPSLAKQKLAAILIKAENRRRGFSD